LFVQRKKASTFSLFTTVGILLNQVITAFTFARCCLCLKIPQQPLEGVLIHLRVCPVSEVADMTWAAKLRRPCLGCLYHALVEAYWKEHFTLLLLLFLQGSFDFIFDPGAC